jgi:glutamate-1-semialdehyde 2,1-aminomutase
VTIGTQAAARSAELVARAERLFPGGVNSPVRAFRAVGRAPIVLERGDGPFVYDADGRRYIDYIVLLPPSQFEAWFVSMAHGRADVRATIEAAAVAFAG